MRDLLPAVISILSLVASSLVAWYAAQNVRKANEASAKQNVRTSNLEERKVDQEAFDRAARLWQAALDRAEKRVAYLEEMNDKLTVKNDKLETECRLMRDLIMQMRGALVAAGVKVPGEMT